MKSFSPAQMRSTNLALINAADARKLGVTASGLDLMREHVAAQNQLMLALEANPDILDMLRERALAAKRTAS